MLNQELKEFFMSLLEELVDARRERQQFKEWWVQERDSHAVTCRELSDLKASLEKTE